MLFQTNSVINFNVNIYNITYFQVDIKWQKKVVYDLVFANDMVCSLRPNGMVKNRFDIQTRTNESLLIRDPEDNKSVQLESERVDLDSQSTFTVL